MHLRAACLRKTEKNRPRQVFCRGQFFVCSGFRGGRAGRWCRGSRGLRGRCRRGGRCGRRGGLLSNIHVYDRGFQVELFARLDFYAYSNKIDLTSDMLKQLPDEQILMTLASLLPFTPAEKQALLECVQLQKFYDTLLLLLEMNSNGRIN